MKKPLEFVQKVRNAIQLCIFNPDSLVTRNTSLHHFRRSSPHFGGMAGDAINRTWLDEDTPR